MFGVITGNGEEIAVEMTTRSLCQCLSSRPLLSIRMLLSLPLQEGRQHQHPHIQTRLQYNKNIFWVKVAYSPPK
jgi:hypothetical protein